MTITMFPEPVPKTDTRPSETESDASNDLKRRLHAEVTVSMEHIQKLRDAAARSFFGSEKNLSRFRTVADQIQSILTPRLEVLANLDALTGSKILSSPAANDEEIGNFHSQTTTFTPPFSYRCPANVQLSFHLRHDQMIENALLEFRLEIIPIFLKFDKKDELSVALDAPNGEEIGKWIDEKLIGFTRTFFEITFHDEYQKRHRVTDPVMKIQFPRAFAFGDVTHEKTKYYFYTQESLKRFEAAPTDYVT